MKALQRRFREFRRDCPSKVEGDVKATFSSKRDTPTRKRKDERKFQIPNGEDEVSFSRHNK